MDSRIYCGHAETYEKEKVMTGVKKCLYPDCDIPERTKGLCHKHYANAAYHVSRGRVTWDELVADGKATRSIKNLRIAMNWFVSARKKTANER